MNPAWLLHDGATKYDSDHGKETIWVMKRLTGDRGKHAKDSGSRSIYDLRGKKCSVGHEPAHR